MNASPIDTDAHRRPSRGAWTLTFSALAAGYALSFLFRNINAVLAPTLAAEFGLSSSALGTLTAVYLLTFSLMQIPLGLLIDRYGVRRVQAVNLAVAALGSFIFAAADGPGWLMLGRALIGAGVAVSLMGGLAVFTNVLPARQVPGAFGLLLAFGGVGAVLAGSPTDAAVQALGWRTSFVVLGVATALTAILVALVVPETRGRPESWRELWAGLLRIFRSPLFWRVAPLGMLTCGTGMALLGLWTGLWLADVAGLGRDAIALYVSAMAVGLTVGSVACGPAAAWADRMGLSLMMLVIWLSGLFLVALALLGAGVTAAALPLWVTIGALINPTALSYPVVAAGFPPRMAGRVNAAVNVLVLFASFAVQVGLGILFDAWGLVDGRRPATAYMAGFGALAVMGALALLWALPAALRPDRFKAG